MDDTLPHSGSLLVALPHIGEVRLVTVTDPNVSDTDVVVLVRPDNTQHEELWSDEWLCDCPEDITWGRTIEQLWLRAFELGRESMKEELTVDAAQQLGDIIEERFAAGEEG